MSPTRRHVIRALPLIAVGLGSSACGYALAGRGSFLPAYIRSLGIPMFTNQTPHLSVEQYSRRRCARNSRVAGATVIRAMPASMAKATSCRSRRAGRVHRRSWPRGIADHHRQDEVRRVKQGKTLWEPALRFRMNTR